MISALCKNSVSETVQQKESYEFHPLGGKLACSFDLTLIDILKFAIDQRVNTRIRIDPAKQAWIFSSRSCEKNHSGVKLVPIKGKIEDDDEEDDEPGRPGFLKG